MVLYPTFSSANSMPKIRAALMESNKPQAPEEQGVEQDEQDFEGEENEHTQYTGEVDVPIEAIQVVDPNVVAKLPEGTNVTTIKSHGASSWTRTARLDALSKDGEPRRYFLKTSFGLRGKGMMRGEFTAMSLIYDAAPDMAPRPIAWGNYADLEDVYFLLCDFIPMRNSLPDGQRFTKKLVELHMKSVSPNGKFGFSVPTYHGNTRLVHGWTDTWEEYFATRTKELLFRELEVQGPNKEISRLAGPFFDKVIPRLLRPLETGGRSIQPCLVHGDLWDGNVSTDSKMNPVIFDAASFYAHNEYDLGVWRAEWNQIPKSYITLYRKILRSSEPKEDEDDRNLLYATRVNILDSILYKNNTGYRKELISGMRLLVEKFPDGYEGWEREQQKAHLARTETPN